MEAADNIIPFLRQDNRALNILAVEDDRIERMFLEQQISDLGHTLVEAENGAQALSCLAERPGDIDVILMDRMMPVMDGLTAVRRIKENPALRRIPVIMVTGAASARDMQEGIDAGVFYYLTKPVNEDVLKSVLTAATREARQNRILSDELGRHKSSFNLIHTCKFHFRTIEQAESLAAFTAHCFPDPERVLPGVAELLTNAVEHGLCGIGYERKGELVANGTLRAEILRRQALPENTERHIEVVITHKDEGIYALVTDPGQGFNWRKYRNIEPSRASDAHGRGIARASALSFDRLTYNEAGNQAIAYVSKITPLEW